MQHLGRNLPTSVYFNWPIERIRPKKELLEPSLENQRLRAKRKRHMKTYRHMTLCSFVGGGQGKLQSPTAKRTPRREYSGSFLRTTSSHPVPVSQGLGAQHRVTTPSRSSPAASPAWPCSSAAASRCSASSGRCTLNRRLRLPHRPPHLSLLSRSLTLPPRRPLRQGHAA